MPMLSRHPRHTIPRSTIEPSQGRLFESHYRSHKSHARRVIIIDKLDRCVNAMACGFVRRYKGRRSTRRRQLWQVSYVDIPIRCIPTAAYFFACPKGLPWFRAYRTGAERQKNPVGPTWHVAVAYFNNSRN